MRSALLTTALKIPQDNFDGLISGRALATVPLTFLRLGQKFAICSEQSQLELDKVELVAWAECVSCQPLETDFSEAQLQHMTCLRGENLTQGKAAKFLAWLRVYRLPDSIKHEVAFNGNFAALETPVSANYNLPVLSEVAFTKRKQQLESCELSSHLELEDLQSQIARLNLSHQASKMLDEDIQGFLGWKILESNILLDSDLSWISQIANVGNSSDGDRFEKLVRKSLIKLGFHNSLNNIKASLDPEATGGAGGIDVYCDAPFSLVGECKATKHESVSNGVSAQLINLGITHLGQEIFSKSVKIIFAAGNLTPAAEKAAFENHMNVMRPETLQRLAELKAQYPGSINLRDLEACLRSPTFGEASDQKINDFIDNVKNQIKLRLHIIQLVKSCEQKLKTEAVEMNAVHTAYALSDPEHPMEPQEVLNILIELSSPLSGYLGRVPGTDRFYFLRELQIS